MPNFQKKTYRQTTRGGGCFHCNATTVMVCEACEQYICSNHEATHDGFEDHDKIPVLKWGG